MLVADDVFYLETFLDFFNNFAMVVDNGYGS